jgi:hypothetical protein
MMNGKKRRNPVETHHCASEQRRGKPPHAAKACRRTAADLRSLQKPAAVQRLIFARCKSLPPCSG